MAVPHLNEAVKYRDIYKDLQKKIEKINEYNPTTKLLEPDKAPATYIDIEGIPVDKAFQGIGTLHTKFIDIYSKMETAIKNTSAAQDEALRLQNENLTKMWAWYNNIDTSTLEGKAKKASAWAEIVWNGF